MLEGTGRAGVGGGDEDFNRAVATGTHKQGGGALAVEGCGVDDVVVATVAVQIHGADQTRRGARPAASTPAVGIHGFDGLANRGWKR